jgi:hypothetical protein
MTIRDQTRDGWTVVLRHRPARIVDSQAEGPYADAFEIVCCNCGDLKLLAIDLHPRTSVCSFHPIGAMPLRGTRWTLRE